MFSGGECVPESPDEGIGEAAGREDERALETSKAGDGGEGGGGKEEDTRGFHVTVKTEDLVGQAI